MTRTLTITYGLRWDYNGAFLAQRHTSVHGGPDQQSEDYDTGAAGTPLWHAQKDDFAPRLGIAWKARPNLVVRAGAGIFYDLGYSTSRMVRVALWAAKLDSEYFISVGAARRRRPFYSTAGSVVGCGGPESRVAQDLRMECRGREGFGNADVMTLTYIGAGLASSCGRTSTTRRTRSSPASSTS